MSIYDYYRWFRTGTVAVTNGSPNVVGTSTGWAFGDTKIRPGDIFTIEGDRFYEVLSVTDDTHLVLASNFLGTTGSGLSYAIIRNFSAAPGAEMVAKQITLIDRSLDREKQYIDWQSLPGDHVTPTTVTFTRYDGSTIEVKTLAQIQMDIDDAIAAGNIGPTGATGPAGPPGPGLVWKGDWTLSATYASADGVSVDNATYICIAPHTALASNRPGTGASWTAVWKLFLQNNPGATGATGPAGATGATGATGPAGATWYTGPTDPSAGTGVNGDNYLNTVSGSVFKKAASTWSNTGNIKGPTGPAGTGIVWLANAWNTYTNFTVNNALRHGASAYIAKTGHTRTADTEPGVGAFWTTYWAVLAQGLDGTNGLPTGGSSNQMLVKQSSADGDATWLTKVPDNSVDLVNQVWTGTSLASMTTRAYTALTDRPADDDFRTLGTLSVPAPDANTEFYFPLVKHIVPDPGDTQWTYGKLDYFNFKTFIYNTYQDYLLGHGGDAFSMGYQSPSNVNITGGMVTVSYLETVDLRANSITIPYSRWLDVTSSLATIVVDSSFDQRMCVNLGASPMLFFSHNGAVAGHPYCRSGRIYFKNTAAGANVNISDTIDLEIGTQPTDNGAIYIMAWEWLQRGTPTESRLIISWIY